MLSRVSDFRCSGGAGGQGGALLLDCPSGGGSGVFSREASSQPSEGGVASRQSTAEVSSDPDDGEEVGGRGGDTEGGAEPVRSLHQSSCEETKQFTREVFLSACQLSALSKVEDILAQLEEAGSWFPNSGRMGQTHPKFRSSHFSRRVEALTLWHKVTVGLADCLSRLSSWVGVQVTTPTGCMCVPPTEPSTAASDVMFVIGRGGREEEGPDDVVMNSLAFNFSRMHTTRYSCGGEMTSVDVGSAGVYVGSAGVDVGSAGVDVDSAGVDVGSAGVDVGSAGVYVGSAGVDVGSAGVDVGSAGVDVDSAGVYVGSAGVDVGSAGVDVGSAGVDVGSAGVDVGSAGVDVDSAGVYVGSAGVDVGSAGVDVGSAGVYVGSAGVDVGSAGVDVGSAGVDVDSAGVYVGSAGVDVGSAGVDVGSAGVDVGSAGVDVGSAGVDVGSAGVYVGSAGIDVGSAGVDVT